MLVRIGHHGASDLVISVSGMLVRIGHHGASDLVISVSATVCPT